MKRDFLICLSFANLAFFRVWQGALGAGALYYRRSAAKDVLVVGCIVLFIGILGWLIVQLARRSASARMLKAVKLLMLITACAWLLPYVFVLSFGRPGSWGKIGLLTTVLLSSVTLTHARVFRVVTLAVLWCSPFLLFTFGHTAWIFAQSRETPTKIVPEQPQQISRGRVLWIIFDELDEGLAFQSRPQSLELPEFDDFKERAWSAARAYPPANMTELSIPALVTGRIVQEIKPQNASELFVRFAGDKHSSPWSKQPSVFSDAKNQGFRTSLVGWYHPYCSVIGGDLDFCFQVECKICSDSFIRDTPRETLEAVMRKAFPLEVWLPISNDNTFRRSHLEEYRSIRKASLSAVNQFDSGLLVLHLAAPHPPAIYSRQLGRFSTEAGKSYLDNLALADHSLGEIRRAMEQRGNWEDTTVILTSDHWWRVAYWSKQPDWTQEDKPFASETDYRVPFLVKLPNENRSAIYEPPFNTVVTRELIMSLLRGGSGVGRRPISKSRIVERQIAGDWSVLS